MPLMKVKPTSPGRRALVKVVSPDLHKGEPHWPLVERQGPAVVNVVTTRTARNSGTPATGSPNDPFFEFFRRFMPEVPETPPEQRGQGYSHELLAHGTATLHTAGISVIRADADVDNELMAKAFRGVGYTQVGTRRAYQLDHTA